MHLSTYHYGIIAEIQAIFYLTCKGYIILKHRYKCTQGEIDIIARKGKTIVFVEVKARKNKEHHNSALSSAQRRRITHAAEYFISRGSFYKTHKLRFDTIFCTNILSIPDHTKNAW